MTRATAAAATADAAAAAGVPGYSGTIIAVVPGLVYVAERPGGGGRSHRVARREHDLAALQAAGVRTIVSGMRSRHALVEYAQAGFGTRWHPLRDVTQARHEVPRMAADVADVLARGGGPVLVHVDRVSEWLAAAYASILVRQGTHDPVTALAAADAAGLPVGDLARDLMGIHAPTVPTTGPEAPPTRTDLAVRAYRAACEVLEDGGRLAVTYEDARDLLDACRIAARDAVEVTPAD